MTVGVWRAIGPTLRNSQNSDLGPPQSYEVNTVMEAEMIGTCKTCGGECRVGTIEELKAGPRTPGCAVIQREGEKGKRTDVTYRCAPIATKPTEPTPAPPTER